MIEIFEMVSFSCLNDYRIEVAIGWDRTDFADLDPICFPQIFITFAPVLRSSGLSWVVGGSIEKEISK